MATGIVKWFSDTKGFGFIIPTEGGENVFVHHTQVMGDGFESLKEGQRVTFDIEKTSKGLIAKNVFKD